MTKSTKNLDTIFEALASKHRREIIHALGLQPYAISQLAVQQKLSLPAIYKHIKILKAAGLVVERKIGRTRFLTLNRIPLKSLQEWVMQYNPYWGSNKETLENYKHYLEKVAKGGDKK